MAHVAQQPCVVCYKYGLSQQSPTQVHHVFHDRFSSKKASDHEVIPLCEGHHLGMFDVTKLAIHRRKETWRKIFGPDYKYIGFFD